MYCWPVFLRCSKVFRVKDLLIVTQYFTLGNAFLYTTDPSSDIRGKTPLRSTNFACLSAGKLEGRTCLPRKLYSEYVHAYRTKELSHVGVDCGCRVPLRRRENYSVGNSKVPQSACDSNGWKSAGHAGT